MTVDSDRIPIHSKTLAPETQPTARALEFSVRNLSRSYGSNVVLHAIKLDIKRGEIVAIIGGSGSGKTTLLRLLTAQIRPDEGSILAADHESAGAPLVEVTALSTPGLDRLRRHWGIVFQGNALFSGSVFDNIAYALREVKQLDEKSIQTRVRSVLHAVELNAAVDAHLNIDDLSGGMAKRVAIARALALEPIVLFYDEPTSGLDPRLAGEIQDLIQRVHQTSPDNTTVIVTHDKDLLYRLQSRVIMLAQSVVVFDGTYDTFARSDAPAIRPYFELMRELNQSATLSR